MGLPDEFKNGEKSMGFRKVPNATRQGEQSEGG